MKTVLAVCIIGTMIGMLLVNVIRADVNQQPEGWYPDGQSCWVWSHGGREIDRCRFSI